jgi:hypothetical protein
VSLDPRRDLEIALGAALNDAEAIEGLLNDVLAKHAANFAVDHEELRDVARARHHAYDARIIIARVFDAIKTNELAPELALAEMRNARESVRLLLPNLVNSMPGRRERSERQDTLLDRVEEYERHVVAAVRNVEVRQLENRFAGSSGASKPR